MKRDILKKQIKNISIDDKEYLKLQKEAKLLIKKFKDVGLKAYIGGSFAKKTAIKKERLQDIDIFVIFNKESDMDRLEIELDKLKMPVKKIHGSRDYYNILLEDIVLEIIPVLKVKNPSDVKNITDMSLSHVKYITKKTKENKKILDEIKLAKSFVMASGCYGAESYIQGFSGYSIELLVIYFGSFMNFLKKIKKEKIIDIENNFKNRNEIMREINSSKLESPIILIDPTYKYRNVSAGLSVNTYNKFLRYAEDFLKNPSVSFFKFKQINVFELEQKAKNKKLKFIELELSSKKQEGDVAGSKMRKLFDFICEELKRNFQKVIENHYYYSGQGDKSKGYILLEESREVDIRGPKEGNNENNKKFKKIHKNYFLKNGYLYYTKIINIKDILKSVIKIEDEMGSKINKVSIS